MAQPTLWQRLFGSKSKSPDIINSAQTIVNDVTTVASLAGVRVPSQVTAGLDIVKAATESISTLNGININDGKAEVAAEINKVIDSIDATTTLAAFKAALKVKINSELDVPGA